MSDDLYREEILELYKHPHNYGRIDAAPSKHLENPLCGDAVDVSIKVEEDVVREARFEGRGCAISIAASSLITDHVRGKRVEEVLAIGPDELRHIVGLELGPVRMRCASLALNAIKQLLKEEKHGTAHD